MRPSLILDGMRRCASGYRWYPPTENSQSQVREKAQQTEHIASDAQNHHTVASVQRPTGEVLRKTRLSHHRGTVREFLAQWTPGSSVAVETVGNWYWLVDEIEEAGVVPRLVHAGKAKLMSGMINKTDKVDVAISGTCRGLGWSS